MFFDKKIFFSRHNVIFKDVYREVGLLEVFVTCLNGYAAVLKEKQAALDQGKGKVFDSEFNYFNHVIVSIFVFFLKYFFKS